MQSAKHSGALLAAAVTLTAASTFAQGPPLKVTEAPAPVVRKVFVGITGDTRLAQRLWTMLTFELEDAGFVTVNSEDKADAVLSGKVETKVRDARRRLGFIRARVVARGQEPESVGYCGRLSDLDSKIDLFDGTAKGLLKELKSKYQNATTLAVVPEVGPVTSPKFIDQLKGSILEAGFTEATTTPDLEVRVQLAIADLDVKRHRVSVELELSRANGRFVAGHSDGGAWDEFGGTVPEWCQPLFEIQRYSDEKSRFYRVAPWFLRIIRQTLRQDRTLDLPHY